MQPQVSDSQVDDLRRPHTGQTQADQNRVAKPKIGAVAAGADQPVKRFLMTEPPARVGRLDLPIQPRDLAERIVSAAQGLDQRRFRLPRSDAPAQESANPRQPVADRVVGPRPPAPGQHRRLGQESWMRHVGEREKRRQFSFVLTARIQIVVAEAELPDQRTASYRPVSSIVS